MNFLFLKYWNEDGAFKLHFTMKACGFLAGVHSGDAHTMTIHSLVMSLDNPPETLVVMTPFKGDANC